MKKSLSIVLLFLGAFSLFTLYYLPASIAYQLVHKQLPRNIKVGTISGSLWKGQLSGIRINNLQLNSVSWEVTPSALLMANLQGKVKFGNARDTSELSGYSHFSINIFNQALSVENMRLRFNAEHVLSQVNLPLPVSARGRVILDIEQYTQGEPYCQQLKGKLSSQMISIQGLSGWFDIGQLAGSLSCKSGNVAVLVDPQNKLGLRADATLAANFKFKVAGQIKPDPSLSKEVHDAVKFLGRPDANGYYPVNL
jgi:general secretion pathway protein N